MFVFDTRIVRLVIVGILMLIGGVVWGQASAQVEAQPRKALCPFSAGVIRPFDDEYGGVYVATKELGIMVTGQDTMLLAVRDGRIKDIYRLDGARIVTLMRDTSIYVYMNMTGVTVTEGQMVKAGQVIGSSHDKRIGFWVENVFGKFIRNPYDRVDCSIGMGK